jgi:hypothetical protein
MLCGERPRAREALGQLCLSVSLGAERGDTRIFRYFWPSRSGCGRLAAARDGNVRYLGARRHRERSGRFRGRLVGAGAHEEQPERGELESLAPPHDSRSSGF